jgi:hypothetical protein
MTDQTEYDPPTTNPSRCPGRRCYAILRIGLVSTALLLAVHGRAAVDEPPAPTIARQIAEAVAAGAHRVTIQPGVYRVLPAQPRQAHIVLAHVSGLEIDATGVTLLCSNLSTALEIRSCRDVTLRGLTIDYDPLPITQGTIVGIAPDRTWTDVRIHQGYPLPTITASNCAKGQGFFWIHDHETRLLKAGTANRFVRDITARGDGIYRLDHGKAQFRDRAAVGDFIRIPQKYEMATGINIHACMNLTLTEVTLLSAPPHFGIIARYGDGLVCRKVRVIPGPPPAGATEPRLFSTVGDGINCGCITGRLVIEDCDLDATGDDGIAIYAEPGLVLRTPDAKRLTVSFSSAGRPPIQPGARLRVCSAATGGMDEVAVVSSAAATMPRTEIEAVRNQAIQQPHPQAYLSAFDFTLARPVHAHVGDMALLLGQTEQAFVIRSNRVNNAGSRGIVANQSWGRVEDNRVTHTFLPGIHVFEFFRSEGGSGFQSRLSICNNFLEDTCLGWPHRDGWQGAISVVSWDERAPGAGLHSELLIDSNQIVKAWGVNIQVQCARGVTLRGNRFGQSHLLKANPGAPRTVDNGALIFLQNVQACTVADNEIVAPGPYINQHPLTCVDVSESQTANPFVKTRNN